MKKKMKVEVLKKGTALVEVRSEENLKEVAAGRPPQLGCGGPGQCLA